MRLSPNPDNNLPLEVDDIIYLWECGGKDPLHLAARGKIVREADRSKILLMPTWQQQFCVDKKTGAVGPQYHLLISRSEIAIDRIISETHKIKRYNTDANHILRENFVLKIVDFIQRPFSN